MEIFAKSLTAVYLRADKMIIVVAYHLPLELVLIAYQKLIIFKWYPNNRRFKNHPRNLARGFEDKYITNNKKIKFEVYIHI